MVKLKQATSGAFHFKQFSIHQEKAVMKVGTDGVLLGAWADVSGVSNILDIGTGTGLIALMLAQRQAESTIHAVEIDSPSFEEAHKNFKASPWSGRLVPHNASIQEFGHASAIKFDLVVSNPPFFSGGTFSWKEEKNNARHTVKLPHGDLLSSVRNLLSEDGRFSVVLPLIEGLRFIELARTYHLYCTRLTEVLPRKDLKTERLLLEFRRKESECLKNQLVIQTGGANEWTTEFRELAKDFYLKM